MPMNRVQFQKGMSLGEFVDRYGTEEACERELEAQRWQDGLVCPSCGSRSSPSRRRMRAWPGQSLPRARSSNLSRPEPLRQPTIQQNVAAGDGDQA